MLPDTGLPLVCLGGGGLSDDEPKTENTRSSGPLCPVVIAKCRSWRRSSPGTSVLGSTVSRASLSAASWASRVSAPWESAGSLCCVSSGRVAKLCQDTMVEREEGKKGGHKSPGGDGITANRCLPVLWGRGLAQPAEDGPPLLWEQPRRLGRPCVRRERRKRACGRGAGARRQLLDSGRAGATLGLGNPLAGRDSLAVLALSAAGGGRGPG
jgi:hypothetical protein